MNTKKILAGMVLGLFAFFPSGKAEAQCSFTPSYSEDFSSYVPTCWTETNGRLGTSSTFTATSSNWSGDGFLNNGTTGSARVNIYGTAADEWLISPEFDLGTSAYQIEFTTGLSDFSGSGPDAMGPDDTLAVVVSTDAGVTWSSANIVKLFTTANQPSNSGESVVIDLSAYSGLVKIGFYGASTISNTDYNVYIDDFVIEPLSSCAKPNSLMASSVTAAGANLSWVDNAGASSWQVEYGVSGFTLGTGTQSIETSTSTSISGLSANTAYDVYVRAICGVGDTSNWVIPTNFLTPCAALIAPFNEDFDALPLVTPYTDLPSCWEPQTGPDFWDVTNDVVNNSHAYLPNIGDHTTGTGNYMWIDASSDILANEMVTPFIDMSGLTTPYVGFWFASNNVDNAINHTISLDAWDGSAWVNITSLSGNFTSWVEVAGTLPTGIPTTTKFRIQAIAATGSTSSNYYQNDLGVDDFFVVEAPTCVKTTNEMSANVTSVSADLSWSHISATSFELTYDVSGFTPGSGANTSILATTSTTVIGLSPSTSYDWYVRAICAPGDTSDWSNASSFKTLCPASFTAPYYNGFEFDVVDLAPECWEFYNTTSGFVEVEDFTGTAAPFAGSKALYLYNGSAGTIGADTLIAISPNFSDLPAGDKRIRFQANADNVTTRLIIGTMPSTLPTAMFTPVDTVTFLADDTYQQVITNFDAASGYNGTDQYIVFAHELDGGTFKYIRIDELNYETIPNCIAPTNLTANANTSTTADLSWTENGSATSWEVEYGNAGFALGAGTSSVESSTTPSLTGLTDNTDYDVYVRAICGVGDTSGWSLATSFSTPCNALVAPYLEDFDGLALTSPYTDLPSCWEDQVGPDFWDVTNDVVNTGHSYLPNIGDHTTGTGNYMWIDASSDITANEMVSPLIDMSGLSSPLIGFWFASNNVDNAINHTISLDAWDGTAWVNIATESGNFPSWVEVSGVLPAGVPTTTKFRIQAIAATGSTSSNYYQNDLGVDDFFVIEAPSCLAPSNLTVSALSFTGADLGWTETGSATEWEVQYDLAGVTPGTGTSVVTTTNPESVSGLTANTDYSFYVRAICGPGDTSAWVGPVNFFTGSCTPGPSSVDGDGITNVTMGTINNTTTSETNNYGDYTAQSTDVAVGSTLPIDITLETGYTYNLWAWVDWNGDLDFDDANEEYYLGESTSANPTTFNASIVVPAGATLGNYRIRIGGADSGLGSTSPSDPCYTGSFGAFEDYTLNVIAAPSCVDPTGLTATNMTGTSADLGWTANGTETMWNIEYGAPGFTLGTGTVVSGVTSNPYTLSALMPCSDYEYYVQADCGAGTTSAMAGPFAFSTMTVALTETDVVTACETFTWIDGVVYTASNNTATYTVVGAGVTGCDSIYSLDLTINNATTGTDTQVACETFTWIDGNDYTASNNTATFTIVGGNANGCDSIVTLDLTINNAATGTDVQTACDMFTWIDGNDYTASNNTATYTIVGGAANGCDSIVTLDLTINTVDASATQTDGIYLSANAVGATYQWIDCDNGNAPIAGETNKDFTATANGNYAVIVTENGCTDTSACILVDNVGLADNKQILGISLYPNPTNGLVTVLFENMEVNEYSIEVIDATGRKLAKQQILDNTTKVDLSSYDDGVYIIRISNGESESIHRVIKK